MKEDISLETIRTKDSGTIYFKCEWKLLSTQNSISNDNISKEWAGGQDIII